MTPPEPPTPPPEPEPEPEPKPEPLPEAKPLPAPKPPPEPEPRSKVLRPYVDEYELASEHHKQGYELIQFAKKALAQQVDRVTPSVAVSLLRLGVEMQQYGASVHAGLNHACDVTGLDIGELEAIASGQDV